LGNRYGNCISTYGVITCDCPHSTWPGKSAFGYVTAKRCTRLLCYRISDLLNGSGNIIQVKKYFPVAFVVGMSKITLGDFALGTERVMPRYAVLVNPYLVFAMLSKAFSLLGLWHLKN